LASHLLACGFAVPTTLTLKMEAICSSGTVETQRTTQRHIPEDDTLHNHGCENLKSYNQICLSCELFLIFFVIQNVGQMAIGTNNEVC
jgi:hypothetical protein